ncbi:peptidylprolyl isomerase [Paenibacillus arenilitoris]|uniref:Peptidyl-prolyl cis-trans isomerase n=1 Tax=Paenibacillus arenilitoris TaxID=2772299 RepID=A0A927H6C4_9BACL|nr:peptidylprolyl isomerase [Paenibacillus arenilitoris]MBD2869840.1 peptidylprolyl isomerase [Paenibacillus arenilitoris]
MTLSNQRKFRLLAAALIMALLLAGCGGKDDGSKQGGDSAADAVKTMSWSKMPEMTIDLDKTYKAKFRTSKGDFTVLLFADEAPVTVNNFVFLAREGFYEGLTFHRIIEKFMIQSGDPQGNGTGTPGYSIPDELDTDRKYEEGIVAMANLSKPNSGGSQFFICTGEDAENLNREPNYTIFGKVESGMDIVMEIAKTPVKDNKPSERVIIESIAIAES